MTIEFRSIDNDLIIAMIDMPSVPDVHENVRIESGYYKVTSREWWVENRSISVICFLRK